MGSEIVPTCDVLYPSLESSDLSNFPFRVLHRYTGWSEHGHHNVDIAMPTSHIGEDYALDYNLRRSVGPGWHPGGLG